MKQENKKTAERRYDKFAVASFVLSLIFVMFLFIAVMRSYPFIFVVVPLFICLLLSIIFGIIGLKRIKKNKNLKGKIFGVIGLIISIFGIFLLCFIYYVMVINYVNYINNI